MRQTINTRSNNRINFTNEPLDESNDIFPIHISPLLTLPHSRRSATQSQQRTRARHFALLWMLCFVPLVRPSFRSARDNNRRGHYVLGTLVSERNLWLTMGDEIATLSRSHPRMPAPFPISRTLISHWIKATSITGRRPPPCPVGSSMRKF